MFLTRATQWWLEKTAPTVVDNDSLLDRELVRKARLLSYTIFFTFIIEAVVLLEYLFFTPRLLPYGTFTIGALLIAIYFNRRKQLSRATWCALGTNIVMITWDLWAIRTTDSFVFLWKWSELITQALLAGFFLSWQGPLLIGGLTCVILNTIFVFHQKESAYFHLLSLTNQTNFLFIMNLTPMVLALLGSFYASTVDSAVRQADRAQEIAWAHQQLEEAHQALKIAYAYVEEMATHDALTGLINHRAFQSLLTEHLHSRHMTDAPFVLVFADLDRFKSINDTWGHAIGDMALKHLASILQNGVGQGDIVARYGGEEFVILLSQRPPLEAVAVAERLRLIVADTPLPVDEQLTLSMTISMGVAAYPQHGRTNTELLSRADAAMYDAKLAGRNRVCLADANWEKLQAA